MNIPFRSMAVAAILMQGAGAALGQEQVAPQVSLTAVEELAQHLASAEETLSSLREKLKISPDDDQFAAVVAELASARRLVDQLMQAVREYPAITGPPETDGAACRVKIQIPTADFNGRHWGVGVLAEANEDQLWVQGSRLVIPATTRRVLLGDAQRDGVDAVFTVVLFSVPTGEYSKDAPISVDDFDRVDLQIHASLEVHRLK